MTKTKFVIELAKDKALALSAKAQSEGMSTEEFFQRVINTILEDDTSVEEGISDERYQEIKKNVLTKYAELYKRLA